MNKTALTCLFNMFFFSLVIVLLPAPSAPTGSEETVEKAVVPQSTNFSTWGTDKLFNDPAWESGIATGAKSLNHSIDLLMETIFYNLLDNQLIYDVNDTAQFALGLKRDLYSAQTGQYVVVDRFSIGPRYLKEMMKVQKIPLRIGGDVSTNVFSIYLRSDAIRLNEDLEQPFVRVLLNNWLGVLPILSAILPPSFNPNEMYDPIRQVTTPFQLPLTADTLSGMELGSIRSYSVTGGVYIGFDILERYQSEIAQALGKDFDLVINLPYSIFRSGEHRINVLRKNEHVAWVGLSESTRTGHGIDSHFGKLYLILSKVVNIWKGVNAPVFPLNIKKIRENIDKVELIYSFDLRIPAARSAYEQAVSGNFTYAGALNETWEKRKIDSGVRFEYKANAITNRSEDEADNSFFVQRTKNQGIMSKSEIEVTDTDGNFSILEAKSTNLHENWNVLVGSKNTSYENRYQMMVKKENKQFVLNHEAKDPYNLTLSFRALDRSCNAEELMHYLNQARSFAMLPLQEIPPIPFRDKQSLIQYRRKYALEDPTADINHIRITPTFLGEFRLDSSIYFSSQALDKIEGTPDKDLLKTLLTAYNVSWFHPDDEKSLAPMILKAFDWAALLLTYPFRLINVDLASTDAFLEVSNCLTAFKQIKAARTPIEKVHGYKILLDTSHPDKLAIALLSLSNLSEIPRAISIGSIGKGDKDSYSIRLFDALNNKSFISAAKLPDTSRFRNLQNKFDQLLPTSGHDESDSVPLKINLTIHKIETPDPLSPNTGSEILVNVCTAKIQPPEARIYVRLEQSGRVDLGRFMLVEKVLPLKGELKTLPTPSTCFKFTLTGLSNPFNGFLLDNVLSTGGDFELFIATSEDGTHWSAKKDTTFHVIDGKIIQDKSD